MFLKSAKVKMGWNLIGFCSLMLVLGCGENPLQAGGVDKKVLILGFDGMDHKIMSRMMEEKKLPNFQRLMEMGDFVSLGTSVPPQSPVAWSNFITGMNPGGHGIFDFIHRNPETMVPFLSTSKASQAEKTIEIGGWVIPLTKGEVKLLRHGKSFWEILEENDIPATIIRVPANFPPVNISVTQLSGMGTPDLQGTYGTFSFYSDDPSDRLKEVSGGEIFPAEIVNHRVRAELVGPSNTFKKDAPKASVDFTVFVDPEHPVAKISIQDHHLILKEGEWSEWVSVSFEMIPFLSSVKGICRFYLKEVRPYFKLYVTPMNIDPSSPALPISIPEEFSRELHEAIGPFYTQGIPEDTKALSQNILNDKEFLEQTDIVFQEQMNMYDYQLDRFRSGVLFFYFGRVDQLGHMFWRTMDPEHPAHDSNSPFKGVIEETYLEMDGVLEKALHHLDHQTTLIVLSDHGFAPFYRAFNLNTWLKQEGYAALREGFPEEFLLNVDWKDTRAYGLGFNGLYLNLAGREKKGIVLKDQERESLLDEISMKLLELTDPKTGQKVVSRVYRSDEIYSGPFLNEAPDLVIGYNKGYRASWETVLGTFSEELFRDNTEKWSGDHLMEAGLVPGILLSNKKIKMPGPALQDLAPTLLAEFGISIQEGMIGKSLF